MKNVIFYLVIIALIVLLIWSLFFRKREVLEITTTKVITTAPLHRKYTDSSGVNHSVFDISKTKVTSKQAKNTSILILDSTAKLLNIEKEKVKSITQINITTKDSLLQAKKEIDQLTSRRKDSYNDEFVSIDYLYPRDSAMGGIFGFKYNQKLNIVEHEEYKKFLFIKYNYKNLLDISSRDKRSNINGVERLTVEPKQKEFFVKLQGIINNGKFDINSTNTGVGLQLDFKRFTLQGDYLYDLNTGEKFPLIQLRINILSF